MRTGVTLVDVTGAADLLLAQGERPTIEGVRKILGTGSPATVNSLLKEYYQTLPGRLNLPAPIASAAAELYQKIHDTALEEVAKEQLALQKQMTQEREQLANERQAFESTKIGLQQQIATLTAEKQALLDQQGQLQQKVATLERNLAEQTARAAAAESKAKAATDERERASAKHLAELQTQREQAEGNERHLLGRIEDQKGQIKRISAEKDAEAAAFSKRISSLETALSDGSKVTAALRNDLTAAQREAQNDRDARQQAESALSKASERHGRELQAVTSERGRFEAELEQTWLAVKQHRQERDDAMRDAARHEGKVQVLQGQLEELRGEIQQLRSSKVIKAG